MKPTIAIAMSGGIDSLVSAYILKEAGHPIFGVHFITGFETSPAQKGGEPLSDLSRQLGISIHTIDLTIPFRQHVVEYFVRTYREGKTPNPCLVCNPVIKFGELFNAANRLGADRLATGHYARVIRGNDGRFRLFKGLDHRKDQSYFLAFLSQCQLLTACFPLGHMHKTDVKAFAKEKGLVPTARSESQDVCFIHEKAYGDFLETYGGLTPEPGPVVTLHGETVGRHNGLHMFTVGQRRGINCPSSEPYYVIRLEPLSNTLVVGRKQDLEADRCFVTRTHWIASPPDFPLAVDVRLRYRHQAVPATLLDQGPDQVMVQFRSPQQAPTPGQGAVFYVDDEVLGSGIISL